MKSIEEILKELKKKARPDQLEGMARYGIAADNRLGVSIPELREMARQIGKNHQLALDLWNSGYQDARILAALVDVPGDVTDLQMEAWVKDLNSWDVCDQVCMNLFKKVPLARKKINDWSQRQEEFVKRAAFTLIATLAVHDKDSADKVFLGFLRLIRKGSTDERNYVKKAVNWALRNIGKRNFKLNRAAIDEAVAIRELDSKVSRWIAADALRELQSQKVQDRINKINQRERK